MRTVNRNMQPPFPDQGGAGCLPEDRWVESAGGRYYNEDHELRRMEDETVVSVRTRAFLADVAERKGNTK